MGDYTADLRDIKFVLFEQVGIDRVLELPRYQGMDRETLAAVVDEAHRFARERLAPLNGVSDEPGATYDPQSRQVAMPAGFREVYGPYCENGWLALSHNPEFGGQGMPYVLQLCTDELFFGACLSFCENSLLTTGAAHLIEAFGNDEQRSIYLEKMYTGQWAGTMCLTEAGAGSDVGACTTRATPDGDDYLIEGEKVFITGGEHDLTDNICHAVLARIDGAPPGTKGISLFVVPKRRVGPDGSLGEDNDVRCTGIEHKLGIHGSPTCTLVFGGEGRCRGQLLGEANKGMRQMFQMMNEARISVGLQGVALGNAAYQYALGYARERIQGRSYRGGRQPGAQGVAIIDHPDVRRMLLWQKAWSEGCRALLLYTGALVDVAVGSEDPAERERAAGLVAPLTPLCKAASTDLGFATTSLAVQTLGGYGYVREFPVEQYLRDVRIASIYEGTNGIQAMDLVGRKLGARGGEDLRTLLGIIGEFCERHADHRVIGSDLALLVDAAAAVADGASHLGRTAATDLGLVLSEASPFLEQLAEVVLAWLLLEQAALAAPKWQQLCSELGVDEADDEAVAELCGRNDEARFYRGKLSVARFYARRTLPLCRARVSAMAQGDRSVLDALL
jgi:alkylation response protein AidB-like acyl-CoA dehydrogenase